MLGLKTFVVTAPQQEQKLLPGQKDHLSLFLQQTLDEFQIKHKPWLNIMIDLCLLVCQDLSFIIERSRKDQFMGFNVQALQEGSPTDSVYLPYSHDLGGSIVLKGCDSEKIEDIMHLALFAVCHLKLEAYLLIDMHIRPQRKLFHRRSFLDSKSLWRWISKLEAFKEPEPSQFEMAVRKLNQTIISVSPHVVFPPPKLLVKLRDQEMEMDKRSSIYAEKRQSFIGDEKRLSTVSVKSVQSMSADVKTGLGSIVSDSNTFEGLIRHQSIAVAFSFSWKNQTEISCQPPNLRIIQYYQKSEPFLDESLGAYVINMCNQATHKCADQSCSKPMVEHVLHYAHKDCRISVKMETTDLECPDDSIIYMWTSCRECLLFSDISAISNGTWLYSFGKYLELLLYSTKFTPDICEHMKRKENVHRHFRLGEFVITFMIADVQRFELAVPRIQLNPEYLWDEDIPPIDPIEQSRYQIQSELKMQVYSFYEGLKEYLDSIRLWFHFNPDHIKSEKVSVQDMFEDMSRGFLEEEMIIYESICSHPIHSLSDVRKQIQIRFNSTKEMVDTWHNEFMTKCKVKPEWLMPDFCTDKTVHCIPGTTIVIREEEPSSIIAFCLGLFPKVLQTPTTDSPWKELGGVKCRVTRLSEDPSTTNYRHWKVRLHAEGLSISCVIYFAQEFDDLRKRCDMDDTYVYSLSRCTKWNTSGGKSKASFFKTNDDQIVLKELCSRWTLAEKDALMKFAPKYFDYMKSTAQNATILAKIFGFYQIKMRNEKGTETILDLSVMEHLFANTKISRKFDLKGVPDRHVKSHQQKVMLDQEWLEGRYGSLFPLYPHSKRVLVQSVRNDTEFLASQNVMDYSLLVGVDDTNQQLVIGIVDFIGPWTWYKLVETSSKSTMSSMNIRNGKHVTVLPPDLYRDRFNKAMDENFLFVPDKWTKLDVDLNALAEVL
ncbi:hypothetical protein EDD86DRAFT_212309 [Gorgonomyces haynaldii]|nr:hypothetical protein EDD86DRAFT_212309 [Gorgonomyces haynaldii]